ncbi:MAG: DUF11 domain-containing protein [Parachlamydiaceae bacterium]|nr:DUF11 domain-containing protein [Parachlamydiaceae bacterium]
MKKQLGLLTSLLFVALSALTFTGCADKNCCDDPCETTCQPVCEPESPPMRQMECAPECPPPCAPICRPCPPICAPVCPPPCAPVCRPVCPPVCPPPCAPVCRPPCPPPCEPVCRPLVKCQHPSSNELCCEDGITVTASNPPMCMLGDQYPLKFNIKACRDVCDVVIKAHLPEGVSFVRSQPEARVEGRDITWLIGPMSQGECRPAQVWLQCNCEGELCACFCATATPVRFCSLLCAHPVLSCEKSGPCEVCPGDPVHYCISVTNRGSCAAEEVLITDNVPPGLEHASGLRTLTFKLGSLEPCQTKKVNVCFTAVQRGKVCNTAVVTACNADSVSCQACTNICKECVALTKTGMKEQVIGKNADYQITVSNPGDKPLTDVIVTDIAPSSTSIVSASGATVNGNQAVWRLRELKPGENATFALTLTTCTPGCFTNRVNVTNCQGCCANAEFTTRWRGRPALHVCSSVTENPLCVGETTSVCVTVVNQGSEADSNVRVSLNFPAGVVPMAVTGDAQGAINGSNVTFTPYNNLGPRQTLRYRVDARAKDSGDARVGVEVSSDSIRTPITEQESIIVN